jgi:aspartate racemase
MKTIGLIGGMSWYSSVEYYRIINQMVQARLGGSHSAKLVLVSLDLGELEPLEQQDRWDEVLPIVVNAARGVERAGAEVAAICTNTTHILAAQVQAAINIPLLHIADAVSQTVQTAGLQRVGLLGTRFTMEENFYRDRLIANGLTVNIPGEVDRALIHRVIYEELSLGQFVRESRAQFQNVMERLVIRGAEGIILGCTEIGMLVKPEDARVPLFDTLPIHAAAIAEFALA